MQDRKTCRTERQQEEVVRPYNPPVNLESYFMGKIINFEELEVWKWSRILTKEVYADFKGNKDYGFCSQIQRSTVSIMNNIAEGFCRKGDKEFYHFLNIAKASCGELKSMYYIAEDIGYIEEEVAIKRRNEANRIMNGIGKLMQYLRN